MAENDGEEKSHEPTAHREEQFREQGDIPRSQEVTAAMGLLVATLMLTVSLPDLGTALVTVFSTLGSAGHSHDMTKGAFFELAWFVIQVLGLALVTPFAILWVGAAVVGLVQSRGVIPKEPIKFNWDKLDIFQAAQKKFFSAEPIMELLKGLLKLGVIGGIVGSAVWDMIDAIPALCGSDVGSLIQAWRDACFSLLRRVLPIAIIIAVLDYGFTWYRHREKMMMTTAEVKEESKEMEGDPHVKAQRKARARRLAAGKTIENVKKADALITNPTHFAVGIRYRPEEAPAPVVVSRGADALAEKIKAEARKHDIPSIENRELARTLFAQCKEGHMIPEKLYGPVARVLAVILRRRQARASQQSPAARRSAMKAGSTLRKVLKRRPPPRP